MRVMLSGAHDAFYNSAIDEALFIEGKKKGGTTLRIYSWSTPAILVHPQHTSRIYVNHTYCDEHDIDISRRITNGRTFYCGNCIGISMVANEKDDMNLPLQEFIHSALDALHSLGIKDATFVPPYEFTVNGRIIGHLAHTLSHETHIMQASIYLDTNIPQMKNAMKLFDGVSSVVSQSHIKDHWTSILQETGHVIMEQLIDAFQTSFISCFKVTPTLTTLSSQEQSHAAHLLSHRYLNPEWHSLR